MTMHSRHVTLYASRGIHNDWIVALLVGWRKPPFNKGAGYIGGATLFVGWKTVGGGRDMYRPSRLRVGVTRNANRVPWTRH